MPEPTTAIVRADPVPASRSGATNGNARSPRGARTVTAVEDGIRVDISRGGREALARSLVPGAVLDATVRVLGTEPERLEEAGRSAYLEKVLEEKDVSEEATSEAIYEGIISFVYDAFRLEHPSPTEEQIEEFVAATNAGLERGLRDAMDLLRAFSTRNSQLGEERQRTLEEVRERVTAFADSERERLRDDLSPTRRAD